MRDFWSHFKENKGAVFGLCLVGFFIIIALTSFWITPHNPSEIYDQSIRTPPVWSENSSSDFILGTDDIGRDLLSRLIAGARVSLGIGFLVVLFSLTSGTLLGLIAGYTHDMYGGFIDRTIMRGVDILMSLPSILLAIVIVSILGPSLFNAIIAVSIVAIPSFIRLVRSSVLTEKSKVYVTAARSYGASHFRTLFVHILPNCLAPLIVQGALAFSDGILNAAALGFLGLGAQPPTAEWGAMLSDSRAFIESSPWLVTLPGLCILVVVLGFNLLGDGLRDALDPRLRKS